MGALGAFQPKMRAFSAALSVATLAAAPVAWFSGLAHPLVPCAPDPLCAAAAIVQPASAPASEEGRLVLQLSQPEVADSVPSQNVSPSQLSAVIPVPHSLAVDDS